MQGAIQQERQNIQTALGRFKFNENGSVEYTGGTFDAQIAADVTTLLQAYDANELFKVKEVLGFTEEDKQQIFMAILHVYTKTFIAMDDDFMLTRSLHNRLQNAVFACAEGSDEEKNAKLTNLIAAIEHVCQGVDSYIPTVLIDFDDSDNSVELQDYALSVLPNGTRLLELIFNPAAYAAYVMQPIALPAGYAASRNAQTMNFFKDILDKISGHEETPISLAMCETCANVIADQELRTTVLERINTIRNQPATTKAAKFLS